MIAPLDVVVTGEPSPQLIVALKSLATGLTSAVVIDATKALIDVPSVAVNILPVEKIGAGVTVAVPVKTVVPSSESVIVTVKVYVPKSIY